LVNSLDIEDLEWRMFSVSEVTTTSATEVTLHLGEGEGEKLICSPDDVFLIQVFLACRTCGIATCIDSEVDVIEVEPLGRAVEGPAAMAVAASENQQTMSLSFGLCPSCRRIADLAERLVSDPSAQPLKASLYPLNCALDALAFIAPGLTLLGEK
jgi:hypothetical protein